MFVGRFHSLDCGYPPRDTTLLSFTFTKYSDINISLNKLTYEIRIRNENQLPFTRANLYKNNYQFQIPAIAVQTFTYKLAEMELSWRIFQTTYSFRK